MVRWLVDRYVRAEATRGQNLTEEQLDGRGRQEPGRADGVGLHRRRRHRRHPHRVHGLVTDFTRTSPSMTEQNPFFDGDADLALIPFVVLTCCSTWRAGRRSSAAGSGRKADAESSPLRRRKTPPGGAAPPQGCLGPAGHAFGRQLEEAPGGPPTSSSTLCRLVSQRSRDC